MASAHELNNEHGLLNEEIKICEEEIVKITEYKVSKFKETVSEDADKINFRQFTFESVLNNTPDDKTIYLLGKLKGDPTENKAIAILSKTEFTQNDIKEFGSKKGVVE